MLLRLLYYTFSVTMIIIFTSHLLSFSKNRLRRFICGLSHVETNVGYSDNDDVHPQVLKRHLLLAAAAKELLSSRNEF